MRDAFFRNDNLSVSNSGDLMINTDNISKVAMSDTAVRVFFEDGSILEIDKGEVRLVEAGSVPGAVDAPEELPR